MQSQAYKSNFNGHQSFGLESLLNAIEKERTSNCSPPMQRKRSSTMSIESILGSGDKKNVEPAIKKARYSTTNNSFSGNAIFTPVSPPPQSPKIGSSSVMTCYHASIAQKSYGSEKRFLCPPPFVTVSGEAHNNFLVSMAVVCETANRQFEHKIRLDDNMEGYLKHLYVAGTAKAKELHLRINLSQQMKPGLHASSPLATFYSNPVTIISKPSKKSARIRNSSTCLFKNSLISLFNRINSQTVRTKYLSTESDKLCAKHSSWTPFEVVVVKQPSNATNLNQHTVMTPITYGSQIVLKDVNTGFLSPLITVCKIEKGKLGSSTFGMVVQMQKVALKLTSSEEPLFLSANGPAIQDDDTSNNSMNHNVNTWLNFVKPNSSETLDADLCWTIVGVSKVEHTVNETLLAAAEEQTHMWNQMGHQLSPPPSPPKTIIPFPIIPSAS